MAAGTTNIGFEEKYQQLLAEGYGDEEDRDEYLAENIFYVPRDARWSEIKNHATSTDIGSVTNCPYIILL